MKKGIFAVVGIIAIAAAWYVFADKHASQENDPEKKIVKTALISPIPFQETAMFSGFVRGERQADIAAKTGGYLVRLTKDEGDRVNRGETLAIIDGSELSAARQSALLSLQSTDKAIRAAEEYYDQKVDEAKTAYDNASGSNERDSAEEALKSAKRLRDAELASLKSQKAGVEGSVLVSEASAGNLVIRAPWSGIVTMKHASLGSFVQPGTSIYSIASPESIEIAVALPESIASRIIRGAVVSVSDSRGGRAEGTIAALATAASESSQRATARIRFTNLPEGFRIGQHVRVSFPVGSPRDALLVPEQAIIALYDNFFIYTAEDGRAVRHTVTLGAPADGGRREILSGLQGDASIIIEGAHAVRDQQPIEESYAD